MPSVARGDGFRQGLTQGGRRSGEAPPQIVRSYSYEAGLAAQQSPGDATRSLDSPRGGFRHAPAQGSGEDQAQHCDSGEFHIGSAFKLVTAY